MSRHLRAGLALAASAALVLLLSGLIGTEVQSVALLGIALGAALALVPGDGVVARVGGFALGLIVAWVAYAVRAAALPDAAVGRTLAVVVALLLCVGIALVTVGRLPLWTLLLGAAAMAGAYETAYAANPSAVLSTSPVWATAVLMTAGLGFFTTAVLAPPRVVERAPELDAEPSVPSPHSAPAQHAAPASHTAPASAPAPAGTHSFPFQTQTEA